MRTSPLAPGVIPSITPSITPSIIPSIIPGVMLCHPGPKALKSTPIRRTRPGCCVEAAAAIRDAARLRRVMNSASSFDHLVGASQQRGRDGKFERVGRLEVNHQFDL
jgi:hypothetical protein